VRHTHRARLPWPDADPPRSAEIAQPSHATRDRIARYRWLGCALAARIARPSAEICTTRPVCVGSKMAARASRTVHRVRIVNLIEFFDKSAEQSGTRPFVVDSERSRSHREVQLASRRIANALSAMDVVPGTHVGLLSPNCTRACECIIGIVRAGAVWVPIAAGTPRELLAALTSTDVEALLFHPIHTTAVEAIASRCPSLKVAVSLGGAGSSFRSLDRLMSEADADFAEIRQSTDDVVSLFSSGGTTGIPKGVLKTNLAWQTMIATQLATFRHDEPVNLLAAPISHAAAGSSFLAGISQGTSNVLLPRFDASRVLSAIEEHKVTMLFLPPTAIRLLLAHPRVREFDYSSLRYFVYGSAPIDPSTVKEAIGVFGPVMAGGFGQTEAGLETFLSPSEHVVALEQPSRARRLSSCGRSTPLSRVEIMKDDGRLQPPETIGEIVLRSHQVMAGYYKNPAETSNAARFGWHHTGDLGFKDDDGFVYLVDRLRDVIISGGHKIFPTEVERVVKQHPAVSECVVVGVPDSTWGEAAKCVVEPYAGKTVRADDLRDICRSSLSAFKVPRSFEFWSELPRGPAGKISRERVRENFRGQPSRRI
jgi:acyl-CoA synthetase (AMP-forming)/AMP-acid ligase II